MSVLTAIIVIALLASLIDWLFFESRLADLWVYQYMKREMWREADSGTTHEDQHQSQMGAGFLISILFSVVFVIFWTVFRPAAPPTVVTVLAWFALLLPFELQESVRLDLHPRYVVQRLLAWLIKLILAGVVVGALL